MTNAELLERLKQTRAARLAETAAARRPRVTAETRLGLAHSPGDRVFDTVSGQEGEVIYGFRQTGARETPQR